jgi:hypothetical protein
MFSRHHVRKYVFWDVATFSQKLTDFSELLSASIIVLIFGQFLSGYEVQHPKDSHLQTDKS